DDRLRIFFSRIIARNDGEIRMSIYHFAHERTFLFVAVAAASENDDEAMRLQFAQSFNDVQQRVRRVRVIYKNLKLTFGRDQLETPGNLRRFCQAQDRVTQTNA